MCQSLLVCADLILPLHNQDATLSQDSIGLSTTSEVKIQDCFVILLLRLGAVVDVVKFEVLMVLMSRSSGCVHVRRVNHNAIKRRVLVRQCAAIDAEANV